MTGYILAFLLGVVVGLLAVVAGLYFGVITFTPPKK